MSRSTHLRGAALALGLIAAFSVQSAHPVSPDHHEFEAAIHAPYAGERSAAREFTLFFRWIDAQDPSTVAWRVDLLDHEGRRVLRTWHGEERLFQKQIETVVAFDGRDRNQRPLPDGFYKVRLTATAGDPTIHRSRGATLAERVDAALSEDSDHVHVQEWDIRIGPMPKVAMPPFDPLPTSSSGKSRAATGGFPYTIYYGNLHGQSNDSDGGGAIGSCSSSQPAQSGAYGPADAFDYARNHGLDFLLLSEHNHYFDGSSGTNTSANPTTAINRYAAGRATMAASNTNHPTFLALYSMEWGVITNGGHLNIINGDKLLAWEYNSAGQLIGDLYVAKSDYAGLYALMKSRGWIGQFNHPNTADQFKVGGTVMGYDANGDEVMVAAEIMNTSAFSSNTTETETSRSTYESAFNLLLERGYHVAPTTNQDNHCANWGTAYTNRTGVLIPTGAALNEANFLAALKARRVFATMDKNSQLIITANGQIMGSRINNSGPLELVAYYANTAGRSVSQVQWYHGVPRRNGTVSLLASTATHRFTPTDGEHFYYAKVTQDDGKILWSAPIWVTQTTTSSDTTPPTVSASVSGTSGTITLNATASDNVGVTMVEFFIDGVARGSDSTAPYSLAFDSTTLANGSHTLTARARDAAGNSSTSSAVSFSVNNGSAGTERIANGGFESGSSNWTATSGVITNDASFPAYAGSWKAWLNGYGTTHTDYVYQTISIPSNATSATLSFYLDVATEETSTTRAYDTLKIQVRNTSNSVLATLATYSNLDAPGGYSKKSFNLLSYKGKTIRVYFLGNEGAQAATSFVIDNVSVITK